MEALIEALAASSQLTLKPVGQGDPREERWGTNGMDPIDPEYENSRIAIVSPAYRGAFDPKQPHEVYFGFHDDSKRGSKIRIAHGKKSKTYKTYKTAMRAVSTWIQKRK